MSAPYPLPTFFCIHAIRHSIDTIAARFEGHWHEHEPSLGSAYRAVMIGSGRMDAVVKRAAEKAKLKLHLAAVYAELTVWIDPGEVAARIGNDGSVETVLRTKTKVPELRAAAPEFSPSSSPKSSPNFERRSSLASPPGLVSSGHTQSFFPFTVPGTSAPVNCLHGMQLTVPVPAH